MDGIFPEYIAELFRLIRSLPSQSPDKSAVMGELCRITRHLGSGNVWRSTLTLPPRSGAFCGQLQRRAGRLRCLFEIARVLVRFDHVACVIVNTNHCIV